jgi:parallel beta-helix repeat protein
VRGEAAGVILRGCKILSNGDVGILLESLNNSTTVSGNTVSGNKNGAILVSYGSRSGLDELKQENELSGKLIISH